jgi:phage-related protein
VIGGEVAHVLMEGIGEVVDVGVGFLESVVHPLHRPNQELKIVISDVFMSLVRLLGGTAPSRFWLSPHLLSLLLLHVLIPMGITLLKVVLQQCAHRRSRTSSASPAQQKHWKKEGSHAGEDRQYQKKL